MTDFELMDCLREQIEEDDSVAIEVVEEACARLLRLYKFEQWLAEQGCVVDQTDLCFYAETLIAEARL